MQSVRPADLRPDQLATAARNAARWIDAIDADLGAPGPVVSFAALRSVLHLLRRTLPDETSAALSDALPTVARGIFHEPPPACGHPHESLLDHIACDVRHEVRPQEVVRAVGQVLERNLPPAMWQSVRDGLPGELDALIRIPPFPI